MATSFLSRIAAALLCLPACGSVLADADIRIMAANTSSGNYQSYDPGHGTRIFQGLDPDVVLIQEFNYGDNSAGVIAGWVSSTFGTTYSYYREGGAQIPNGIISRWPIIASGEWDDTQVSNRDFAWARIDIPGSKDLWAISVHLLSSSASVRNTEATALRSFIQANVPTGDYLVIGGDFNTGSRTEAALTTLSSVVQTSAPWPVDRNNNGNTNASRAQPYDWVLADADLAVYEVPLAIGSYAFQNGLVFDSRVYTPLSDVVPVLSGDSGATNMQHMAVVRQFRVPDAGTPPPPSGGALTSGVTVNDSVAAGAWDQFYIDVPAGAGAMSVELSGNSGDADLYVRKAGAPTASSYDFRPYLSGSNETVTVNGSSSPVLSSGRWYIGVNGYSAASYSLRATVSSGGSGPTTLLDVSSSVAQGAWKNYTVSVAAGVTSLQITMTGSGDGDLYVRAGAQPTTSAWDYRPYLGGSNESVTITPATAPSLQTGTYYVSVYGYAAATFALKVVSQ